MRSLSAVAFRMIEPTARVKERFSTCESRDVDFEIRVEFASVGGEMVAGLSGGFDPFDGVEGGSATAEDAAVLGNVEVPLTETLACLR